MGMDKVDKVSSSFMSEVDKILSLGSSEGGTSRKDDDSIAATSEDEDSSHSSEESEEGDEIKRQRSHINHEDDENDSYSDDDETTDEEEELSEGEMRLLNMIKINKIDVKLNFPKAYSDTACHFCREEEDSEHLAQCPVYSTVMRGTEFEDIKSKDVPRG